MNGYLIYRKEDYRKNRWFANHIIEIFKLNNLNVELLIFEHILIVQKTNVLIYYKNKELNKYDFVLNRTRDYNLAYTFEKLNYKVFNNSKLSRITNDKYSSYQFCTNLGINSLATELYFNGIKFHDKVCVKKRNGYGGSEVYLVNGQKELDQFDDNYIVQKYNDKIIGDIRTYIINNKIIASIIRKKNEDFRTNVSLGAIAELYVISKELEDMINIILSNLKCDFVGIDFLIDEANNLYFNEIEDVVGCRSLYDKSDIDIIKILSNYIKSEL